LPKHFRNAKTIHKFFTFKIQPGCHLLNERGTFSGTNDTTLYCTALLQGTFISILKLILLRLFVVLPSSTANVAYSLTLLTQLLKFRHNASSKYKIQQNSELNPNAHAISFAPHPKSTLLHSYTLHFRKFYFASSLHHKH
jgi:hypothetical protein